MAAGMDRLGGDGRDLDEALEERNELVADQVRRVSRAARCTPPDPHSEIDAAIPWHEHRSMAEIMQDERGER